MPGHRVVRTAAAVMLAAASSCSPAGSGAVRGDVVTIAGVDVPLSFEPDEIELEAGRYKIVFDNRGMLPHQLAIGDADPDGSYPDGDSGTVAGGTDESFTVELEPGRQTFACYVDRHNEAGMTGVLVVR